MWRKNRSVSRGSSCNGVDLNRNFDANWCSACSLRYYSTTAALEQNTAPLVVKIHLFITPEDHNC